ncbi:MAG TPA: endonuclease/exonuclease/phosphatase family protein [Ideonella sp.]|uniref:endonuclease/exonuclease/phosphatase family protein n=1 Tax=Ideonella sp. TaxID=1929293 RepID=UPI002D104402|nr:endonuclease/exonuclease/phosphatase family protein [Ideonella sp.]HSI48314.1 endonuclease/exonuclease/phosphatase family protein [Ideonella sp.]
MLASNSAPFGPRGFCVLTINIHKGFSSLNRRFVLPALRDAMRAVGADVVLLQEVHGRHAGHGARVADWPNAPHYEFLADTVWHQHAYGRNAVYTEGDHGNAVLSKFPIVRWHNHEMPHDRPHEGATPAPEARGLLHCVLDLPGQPQVHVICVHLGLRERDRQQQIRRLGAVMDQQVPEGAPLIVAGDFNDWRGLAHAPLMKLGLREVHAKLPGGMPRTFPARLPLLRLDRIYVRGMRRQAPLRLPRRPWAHLSDHAPLAAQLEP